MNFMSISIQRQMGFLLQYHYFAFTILSLKITVKYFNMKVGMAAELHDRICRKISF